MSIMLPYFQCDCKRMFVLEEKSATQERPFICACGRKWYLIWTGQGLEVRQLKLQQTNGGEIDVTVYGCARCGETHTQMKFKKFSNSAVDAIWTHWGMCPKLNEPVLLLISKASA